ncbi:MAG: dihydrodipicolinate synthase family protein [Pseudonocardiaceae bacterium]|nr:dihydrodipicolinate synthase family protein [Pseudonocardiaceae bacterium]
MHVGLEELSLPMLAVGATGMISAVANVFPTAVAALYDAVRGDDLTEAGRLRQVLWRLNKAVFLDQPHPDQVPDAPARVDPEQRGATADGRRDTEVEALRDQVLAAAAHLRPGNTAKETSRHDH